MVVRGTRHDRIAQIAGAQCGRIAHTQLVAAGLTRGEIRTLIASGQLRRRRYGVYAAGHEAEIPLAVEAEALLACGDGAALSYGSAGPRWGMTPPLPLGSPVSITTRSRHRHAGITVHCSGTLLPADVRIRDGLPVTAPARTLLDLAGELTLRQLERAFDQALIQRLMRPVELQMLLERTQGRPGQVRLRALLEREHGPGITRSEAEDRFLALVRAAQLPQPEVNVRLHGWEVDCLWRAAGLVVEIDGYRYHATRATFERDRRKDADLREHGLTVLRITWRQLEDEPLAVVARLSRWLAAAADAAGAQAG